MSLICKGNQYILWETDRQKKKKNYKLSNSGEYCAKVKRMMGKSGGGACMSLRAKS